MPKMPKKLTTYRKTQNARKLKLARKGLKTKIARNSKGLLKPKMPKYQKTQKSKKPQYQR